MMSSETIISRGCPGYEGGLDANWNGNVVFGGTPKLPQSIEELSVIVATASPPIRVVGRGHSFTPLAECSGGTLISLVHLNRILEFAPPSADKLGRITVQGGTTYTEIIQYLGKNGALRNLPSCPQFTVAGAIATGTHGSGVTIPNLSADISMLEFVTGHGSTIRYDRDNNKEILEGCRTHLGCLGIISTLTLDVVPYYEVECVRYDDVPLQSAIQLLPKLWNICDSLSMWTSGFGKDSIGEGKCWMAFRHFTIPESSNDVMIKETDTNFPKHENAIASYREQLLGDTGKLCDRLMPRYCNDAAKYPGFPFRHTARGPWHDILTVTMFNGQETPMPVVDLQAEFFVPLERAQDAIQAVWTATKDWSFSPPWGYEGKDGTRGLVDGLEFRQVRGGDGGWLSPHPVDSLGIHISFNGDPSYRKQIRDEYVPQLERALIPFGVRAHWGKLANELLQPTNIEETFEDGLFQFRDLCTVHDPSGKFRNSHIQKVIFGVQTGT